MEFMVALHSMFVDTAKWPFYHEKLYGGFHSDGGTPMAGWLISWKISLKRVEKTGGSRISGNHHIQSGWWLGHPSEKYDFVN